MNRLKQNRYWYIKTVQNKGRSMSNAISAMNSQMAAQTASMQMACKGLAQQKMEGAIALQLLQGAINLMPQDPSTITPEQLKSPIDIRV